MRKRERRDEGAIKEEERPVPLSFSFEERRRRTKTRIQDGICLTASVRSLVVRSLSLSLCESGTCYRRGRSRVDLREGVAVRQRVEVGDELRRERAEDREMSGTFGT